MSGVSDRAVELAALAQVNAVWPNSRVLDTDRLVARRALEAALPAIREGIAAEVLAPIEFISAICEAREMLAPGDRDIETIKGIADRALSTAKEATT